MLSGQKKSLTDWIQSITPRLGNSVDLAHAKVFLGAFPESRPYLLPIPFFCLFFFHASPLDQHRVNGLILILPRSKAVLQHLSSYFSLLSCHMQLLNAALVAGFSSLLLTLDHEVDVTKLWQWIIPKRNLAQEIHALPHLFQQFVDLKLNTGVLLPSSKILKEKPWQKET